MVADRKWFDNKRQGERRGADASKRGRPAATAATAPAAAADTTTAAGVTTATINRDVFGVGAATGDGLQKCEACGKEVVQLSSHRRFCKGSPNPVATGAAAAAAAASADTAATTTGSPHPDTAAEREGLAAVDVQSLVSPTAPADSSGGGVYSWEELEGIDSGAELRRICDHLGTLSPLAVPTRWRFRERSSSNAESAFGRAGCPVADSRQRLSTCKCSRSLCVLSGSLKRIGCTRPAAHLELPEGCGGLSLPGRRRPAHGRRRRRHR